jgi:siroheme synthase (precorrin-2 oxidase/ferrochelatase)
MFDRIASWLASGLALIAVAWGWRYRYQAQQMEKERQRQEEARRVWTEQAATRQRDAHTDALRRPPPDIQKRTDFEDAP